MRIRILTVMKVIVLAITTSIAFALGVRLGMVNGVLIVLLQVGMMGLAFLFLSDGQEEG